MPSRTARLACPGSAALLDPADSGLPMTAYRSNTGTVLRYMLGA
jgi:hypothetical protein